MAEINIKNLLLRTEVGFKEHERGKKQDLIINLKIDFDTIGEEINDNPEMALDYRAICKQIIDTVENNNYNLIETVAHKILTIARSNKRVKSAEVEVDKPHALRFADSVSVKLTMNSEP